MRRGVSVLIVTMGLVAVTATSHAGSGGLDCSTVGRLAVQDNGRLKPFDTYAREQVRFICGRERIEGQDPVETVLSMAFDKEAWIERPVLDVPYIPLLHALGYTKEKRRLSYRDYRLNLARVQELALGRRGARLAEAANELEARAAAFELVRELEHSLPIVPPPDSADAEWQTLDEMAGYPDEDVAAVREAFRALREAFIANDADAFSTASAELGKRLRALNPGAYPGQGRLALECRTNALKPFRATWLLYVLTFVCALVALWSRRRPVYAAMLVVLALSLAVHTCGLVVRTIIAGRAPLTNMYESLVLMSWGIAALGLIFEAKYRTCYAALVAAALGVVTMAIAQRLNFDITPAMAVLRSAWLSYHVLTVMLGYSAFAVALGAGHIVLGRYALGRPGAAASDRLNDFVYRVVQVGVLFLAAGIITGSIWANYSWGRYWGWDPKETWSLITLLGYLAVLHARYQGWLRGFGMGVAAVLCFLLVVMTYYGVNYVLHGLHSYAGEGPQRLPAWLIAFVSFELGFVGAAGLVRHVRGKATAGTEDEDPRA